MLDAASLDSITQEARSCFLYEDAPEYLAAFESGLQQLTLSIPGSQPDVGVYNGLMRSAHSLKGGAGIAQLPHLQRLSHQLEDLLEALNGGRVADSEQAHQLLFEGLERVNQLIAAAIRSGEAGEAEAAEELEIYQLLDLFLGELPEEIDEIDEMVDLAPNSFLVETALTVDLEECIQRVEGALDSDREAVKSAVPCFVEECILLGEALNLQWLCDVGKSLQEFVGIDAEQLADFTRTAISTIREQREQQLGPSNAVQAPVSDTSTDELNLLAESEESLADELGIPDIKDASTDDEPDCLAEADTSPTDLFNLLAESEESLADELEIPDVTDVSTGDELACLEDTDASPTDELSLIEESEASLADELGIPDAKEASTGDGIDCLDNADASLTDELDSEILTGDKLDCLEDTEAAPTDELSVLDEAEAPPHLTHSACWKNRFPI